MVKSLLKSLEPGQEQLKLPGFSQGAQSLQAEGWILLELLRRDVLIRPRDEFLPSLLHLVELCDRSPGRLAY